MKLITLGIQALVVWLSATSYCVASDSSTCPATIRLSAGVVVPEDIPEGYRPLISKNIVRLSGASVFDGPPEKMGILIPTTYSSSGSYAKWEFEEEVKYDISVSCDYAGGLVRLLKKIKPPVSSCAMTSRKIEPTKIIGIKFNCR